MKEARLRRTVTLSLFAMIPFAFVEVHLSTPAGAEGEPATLFAASVYVSQEWYVTPTGSGRRDGSSWENASDSIETMIQSLSPGDTLWLGGGVYAFPREISVARSGTTSQRITISSSGDPVYGGPVTLQGMDNGYDSLALLDIDGSHWVIRGISRENAINFTSLNLDPGSQHSRGFLMLEGDDFLVENTNFFYQGYQSDNSWGHTRQSGITTGRRDWYAGDPTSEVEIRFSAFYNLGFGSQDTGRGGALYASNTSGLSFHDNEVFNTFNGIQFEGTNRDWQIYANVFHDNWNVGVSAEQQGVSGEGVSGIRIFNNTFYDNYVGAMATWCACGSNLSRDWHVYNNLFYRTDDSFSDSQYFYLLTGIRDSLFYNNVIIDPYTTRWGGTGQAFYITDDSCGCSENRENRFLNNTFVNRQNFGSVEFMRIWQSAGRATGNQTENNLLYVGDGSRNSVVSEGPNTFARNPYFSEADDPFVDIDDPPMATNRQATGLTLVPECLAIDAGASFASLFTTDFLGNPRDSWFDVGAYEWSDSAPTFADVLFDHPYHDQIEALYQAGFTAGCQTDPLMYCPDQAMTRSESAVFVERGLHGVEVAPPDPVTSVFEDVQPGYWGLKWATALWGDGYTAGCGADPLRFCPERGHTRAEGAVFYLRMLHGVDYIPPDPQGIFADVPVGWWGAKWAEAAYGAGLIEACGEAPLRFCPDDPLTRGLAASMMVQAKGLIPGLTSTPH